MEQTRRESVKVLLNPHLEAALSCGSASFAPLNPIDSKSTGSPQDRKKQSGPAGNVPQLPRFFMSVKSQPHLSGSSFFSLGDNKVYASVDRHLGDQTSGSQFRPVSVTIHYAMGSRKPFGQADEGQDVSRFLSGALSGTNPNDDPEVTAHGDKEGPVSTMSTVDSKTIDCLDHVSLLSSAVSECLEAALVPNPTSSIDVRVMIISDGGMILPAILNACCLALVDAKVPLLDFFAAVSVFCYPSPKTGAQEFSLDLDKIPKEFRGSANLSELTAAYLTHASVSEPSVIYFHSCGPMVSQHQSFVELLRLSRLGTDILSKEMVQCVKKSIDS